MKTMRYLSWLAIAAMILSGCNDTFIDPHYGGGGHNGNGGNNSGGGSQQPQVTLTERTDWSVLYRNRSVYGDEGMKEEFQFNYTGNNYFILRTVTEADFNDYYGGSVQTLIDEEVAWTLQTAKNQNKDFKDLKSEVFDKTVKTFYSGILIHDTYTAYIIEMDASGKATYNYAKSQMTVQEEDASEEYTAWLGAWTVSDGYVGYDIEISALENNYFYRVDGWEAGRAAGTVQMDQDDDWVETCLNEDGSMSFFIQFIARYDDYDKELGDVDFMFVGTYLSADGEHVDDTEGREIARAEHYNDDGLALLNGQKASFTLDGGIPWTPYYYAMRYAIYSFGKEEWVKFHDTIPVFDDETHQIPMMYKTKASVDVNRTTVHTRNYVRRTQPKAK